MGAQQLTVVSEISFDVKPAVFRLWTIHAEIHHKIGISPSKKKLGKHNTPEILHRGTWYFFMGSLLVQRMVSGFRRVVCSPGQRSTESRTTHVGSLSCLSPKPVEFGITHSPGIVTSPSCTNTQRVRLGKQKIIITRQMRMDNLAVSLYLNRNGACWGLCVNVILTNRSNDCDVDPTSNEQILPNLRHLVDEYKRP
jgi:hypothetical protein